MNDVYKTKRLKNHFCTTCAAYKTVYLCNNLQAHYFGHCGKTCRQDRVVFKVHKSKEHPCTISRKLYQDRYRYTMLSNILELLKHISLSNKLNKPLLPGDYMLLNRYISKLEHLLKENHEIS